MRNISYNQRKPTIMKLPDIIFLLFFLSIAAPTSCFSQQGVVSAGGEATGSGGTMSFSAGQADFMYFSSETGSIQFGLQQGFFFEELDPEVPPIRNLSMEDIFQGEDQCFDATQTIILAGGGDTFIVEDGTGVDLIAGYSILMLPGTMVEHGGYMHAQITSSEGPFCEVEEPIVATIEVYEPDNEAYEEPLSKQELDDPDKPFFRVYPNPTTGDLTVEITADYSDSPYTIEVYGMRGEIIIRNEQLTGWQHHLSLYGQQPGLYMIRVQRGEEMGVERIIKH